MNEADDGFLNILRTERRDLINRLRETRFSTLKKGYSHTQLISHSTYSPWLDDVNFLDIFEKISQNTLVDRYRCYELAQLARQVATLPGDVVEIGVWRGGTAALLGAVLPDKTTHLFDTFSGVAKADKAHDTLYSGGEHADTDIDIVKSLMRRMGLDCEIHVGIFPEDTIENLPSSICLAHIDVDTYGSAKESFEAIWPRLCRNGVVVFDDYGFFGCEGVTQAVHEILSSIKDAFFIHNLNGHAVLLKTS